MPQLLLFAPTEKVVVDYSSMQPSLIGLLHHVAVRVLEGQPPVEDAQVPIRWSIFTLWQRLPGEEAKKFEQRTVLVQPDGEDIFSAVRPFRMDQRVHIVVEHAPSFPIAQAGEYRLILSLREVGSAEGWAEVASYPIQVVHQVAAANEVDETEEQ